MPFWSEASGPIGGAWTAAWGPGGATGWGETDVLEQPARSAIRTAESKTGVGRFISVIRHYWRRDPFSVPTGGGTPGRKPGWATVSAMCYVAFHESIPRLARSAGPAGDGRFCRDPGPRRERRRLPWERRRRRCSRRADPVRGWPVFSAGTARATPGSPGRRCGSRTRPPRHAGCRGWTCRGISTAGRARGVRSRRLIRVVEIIRAGAGHFGLGVFARAG
jgi:hypothetical protein